MTATSADQCVAYDGLIQPDKIPGATSSDNRGGQLNAAAIIDACQQARSVATQVRTGVSDVSAAWTVMPSVFEMPGADPVYNAMTTPGSSLVTFAGNLDRMATALEDFAGEIEPLRISFDEVRGRAQEFVNSLEPGNKVWMRASSTTSYQWDSNASPHSTYSAYSTPSSYTSSTYGTGASAESGWYSAGDAAAYLRGRGETARVSGGMVEILVTWLESGEHVRRNNDLMDEVADLYARLHAAEVECANRINAMREDMCVAPLEAVEAWQLKQDGVELPWGARVEEQRNCGEQVGHGFYQFGKGTVEGLGSLISYNPMTGDWGDWDHAGATWSGIGDIVVAIGTLGGGPISIVNVAVNGPGVYAESFETVKELGKSLVAWDTWEDAPAQAATETILNIGTAFIPVGGWALAGTKGLSAAAGATRITAALGKLDNLGPAVLARLLPDGPRINAPRLDFDGVRIDVDMPSNPGGLVDDAARVANDAGSTPGGGRADAPAGPGAGLADDAARVTNDAPAGPGGGAADDAARAGGDTTGRTDANAGSGPESTTANPDGPNAPGGPDSPAYAEAATGTPDPRLTGGELLPASGRHVDLDELVPRGPDDSLPRPIDMEVNVDEKTLFGVGPRGDVNDFHSFRDHHMLRDADGRFVDYDWPANNGAVAGSTRTATVEDYRSVFGGDVFTRAGHEGGAFGAPINRGQYYSFDQATLRPETLFDDLHHYRFAPDADTILAREGISMRVEQVAPGLGRPGGGMQIRWVDDATGKNVPMGQLLDKQVFEEMVLR